MAVGSTVVTDIWLLEENLALELATPFYDSCVLHYPPLFIFMCFKEVGTITADHKGHDPPVFSKHSVRPQAQAYLIRRITSLV